MWNNSYRTDNGKLLVERMKDGSIPVDRLTDHGKRFHDGYDEMYLDYFKTYLGSVSRYLQNKRLADQPYRGE